MLIVTTLEKESGSAFFFGEKKDGKHVVQQLAVVAVVVMTLMVFFNAPLCLGQQLSPCSGQTSGVAILSVPQEPNDTIVEAWGGGGGGGMGLPVFANAITGTSFVESFTYYLTVVESGAPFEAAAQVLDSSLTPVLSVNITSLLPTNISDKLHSVTANFDYLVYLDPNQVYYLAFVVVDTNTTSSLLFGFALNYNDSAFAFVACEEYCNDPLYWFYPANYTLMTEVIYGCPLVVNPQTLSCASQSYSVESDGTVYLWGPTENIYFASAITFPGPSAQVTNFTYYLTDSRIDTPFVALGQILDTSLTVIASVNISSQLPMNYSVYNAPVTASFDPPVSLNPNQAYFLAFVASADSNSTAQFMFGSNPGGTNWYSCSQYCAYPSYWKQNQGYMLQTDIEYSCTPPSPAPTPIAINSQTLSNCTNNFEFFEVAPSAASPMSYWGAILNGGTPYFANAIKVTGIKPQLQGFSYFLNVTSTGTSPTIPQAVAQVLDSSFAVIQYVDISPQLPNEAASPTEVVAFFIDPVVLNSSEVYYLAFAIPDADENSTVQYKFQATSTSGSYSFYSCQTPPCTDTYYLSWTNQQLQLATIIEYACNAPPPSPSTTASVTPTRPASPLPVKSSYPKPSPPWTIVRSSSSQISGWLSWLLRFISLFQAAIMLLL